MHTPARMQREIEQRLLPEHILLKYTAAIEVMSQECIGALLNQMSNLFTGPTFDSQKLAACTLAVAEVPRIACSSLLVLISLLWRLCQRHPGIRQEGWSTIS